MDRRLSVLTASLSIVEVTLLRERLATLLRHRGELQTVRAMLQHLHDQETSDEEEEPHDEEEEEGEEEQRGRRGGEEEVKAMSAWASAGSRLSLDDTSLLSEMPGRTDSATSPVRKPMGSLASRAMRLGVSPDLLAQMLARPQGQPAAMSEVILPGIALKGYRRIEGPTSHA